MRLSCDAFFFFFLLNKSKKLLYHIKENLVNSYSMKLYCKTCTIMSLYESMESRYTCCMLCHKETIRRLQTKKMFGTRGNGPASPSKSMFGRFPPSFCFSSSKEAAFLPHPLVRMTNITKNTYSIY